MTKVEPWKELDQAIYDLQDATQELGSAYHRSEIEACLVHVMQATTKVADAGNINLKELMDDRR